MQLNASLRLQAFFPAAFDHGTANVKIVGNASQGYKLMVTRGHTSKTTFELHEVPESFLRDHLSQIPPEALDTLRRFSPYLRTLSEGVVACR